MEVTLGLKTLRALAWAAPFLALVWALFADRLRPGETDTGARRQFLLSAAIAAVILIACAIATNAAVSAHRAGLIVWLSILAGGAASLLSFVLVGHLLRKTGAGFGHWLTADTAAAAIAFPVLFGAYLILRQGARPDEWLAAAGFGAALACAAAALSSGRLARSMPPLELTAVSAALAAAGIMIGRLHLPEIKHAGGVIVLLLALALLAWVVLSVIQRLWLPSSRIAAAVGFIAFTALMIWLGHAAATASFLQDSAVRCFWAGLALGLVGALLGTAGVFHTASPYFGQAKAIGVLLVLSAAAFGLRLMGGFGGALCASGILCGVFAWALLAPFRADSERGDPEIPPMLIWAPAFLTVFAAMRAWLTWHGAQTIDVFGPYPFLGLTLGIALPFLVWIFAAGPQRADPEQSAPSAVLAALFGIIFIAGAVVLTSVVLREPAVRLFLFGLAAAGLAGSALATARGNTWATAPVASLSLTAALLALASAPALQALSAEASRPDKVKTLVIVFVVGGLLYLVLEVWRLLAAPRSAA